MAFYVRYYLTDETDLTLDQLESGLQEFDPSYAIPHEEDAGELHYAGETYAEIEINRPGDTVFDEEIEETIEDVETQSGPRAQYVIETLRETTRTVALRILYQGREAEQTLTKIDPLLVWLMMNREGMLHVDGEGFYEGEELVFEME